MATRVPAGGSKRGVSHGGARPQGGPPRGPGQRAPRRAPGPATTAGRPPGGAARVPRAGAGTSGAGRPGRSGRSRASNGFLILFGWIARALAAAWMLVAHAVGFAARGLGRSAADLDPMHRRDGAGLAFLGAALVVAATTWFHLGNAVGKLMTDVVRGGFGSMAWSLPVLLALLAWRYLRHPDRNAETGRIVIGGLALTVGVLGLVHIAHGTPSAGQRCGRDPGRRGLHRLLRLGAARRGRHALGRGAAAGAGLRVRAAGDHRHPAAPGAGTPRRAARRCAGTRRRGPGGRRRK